MTTDLIPRFSRQRLDRMALEALDQLVPGSSCQVRPLELYRLADNLGLLVLEGYLSPRGDILGMTVFGPGIVEYVTTGLEYRREVMDEGTVLISPDHPLRQRFTLAHEISHWLLHRQVFSGDPMRCLCRDIAPEFQADPKTPEHWLEWQANSMASCLLMPLPAVSQAVYSANPHFSARPYLIEGEDSASCNRTVSYISKSFEVSRTAARIRLRQLGFIRRG